MRVLLTPICCFVLVASGCAQQPPRYAGPLEPTEALGSFQLIEGFSIDLYAAEPLVMDPVEIVFDDRGDAWVVEMPDYPDKPAPGQGRGRIVHLSDTDGDGQADQRKVFADGISEATSVMPWRDGLIVTAAPDILLLKDTDADGAADTRELLFTGFFENNSEAQITNLRLNPDGWIYASNFGQAGTVSSPAAPTQPAVDVRGADFRFKLDPIRFEPAAGPTQFGQAVDAWGNRFASHNSQHINQFVIPWQYLQRHPHLPNAGAIQNISDHELEMFQATPPPYWRAERTARRQKQYDEAGSGRVEYAEDHFTGASGGTIYDGDLFPQRYRGTVFTGDVAGNLIHRDSLTTTAGSPAFVAMRPFDERSREFLTSTDPWFRPANFQVGPDGALYVVDMYRQHIETPVSIPEDLKADMDFYAGKDRGRIYRIRPGGTSRGSSAPAIDLSVEVQVAALADPNGWRRRTAQRQLLEKKNPDAVPHLQKLLTAPEAPARLLALYLLEAYGALSANDIDRVLEDKEPGIRMHAIRLAETHPSLAPRIDALVADPSALVAMQAALSAGNRPSRQAAGPLAEFIRFHSGNRWMRLAALSAPAGATRAVLDALGQRGFFREELPERAAYLEETAAVLARRGDPELLNAFVDFLVDHPAPFWVAAGFEGLKRGHAAETTMNLSPRAIDNINAFMRASSARVQELAVEVLALTNAN